MSAPSTPVRLRHLCVVGLALALVTSLSASGCESVPAPTPAENHEPLDLPTGTMTEISLDVDGTMRTAWVYAPGERMRPSAALLFLHGGGPNDGDDVAGRVGLNELAEREGFLAVYPNGIDDQWNDGRGVAFGSSADLSGVDDVGFIDELISVLVDGAGVDPEAVFVGGASNGGMMTYRIGCELADRLAGIAPVIASMPEAIVDSCRPARPIPVQIVNGTADPLVPFGGGPVTVFGKEYGNVVSTAATVDFWSEANGCGPGEVSTDLPDIDPNDSSTVRRVVRSEQCEGAEVTLYEVDGGGHSLPGADVPDRERLVGPKNNDVVVAELYWEFAASHLPE